MDLLSRPQTTSTRLYAGCLGDPEASTAVTIWIFCPVCWSVTIYNPEILVVPREKTPTGAAARGNP